MEQRGLPPGEDGGSGGEAEPPPPPPRQRGGYGPSQLGNGEQEWGGGQGDPAMAEPGGYREVAPGGAGEMSAGEMSAGEMSASEVSQSDGSEDEDDDDDDEEEGEGDMVDTGVEDGHEGKRGGEGGGKHVQGAAAASGGLPPAQMGAMDVAEQGRQEAAARADGRFPRSVSDRERAALKAAASPFGMFHSPSSTVPFLNSFASTSSSAAQLGGGHGHPDATPTQNGGGMGGAGLVGGAAATVSYSLARDGGLSRDASREGYRENAVVGGMQEQARVSSGPPLHEQLQSSTDADNYYTTLLNTQINSSNGLKGPDSATESGERRRVVDPQSTAEPSLRRILSDPLTGALMDDAMIISCGHSVGNAGLRRVMETNICIICGASVRTDVLAPNYALRLAVEAYKREEEMNGNTGIKPAKRRREPAPESIGLPDQAAADTARAKGVQFPFVVSDRVMIKGNKRTPERFVGREAVVTTQCLNGWYLVRTLDSGESVRLQYRSLQKVGGSWPGSEPAMAEFTGVNFGAQCVQ